MEEANLPAGRVDDVLQADLKLKWSPEFLIRSPLTWLLPDAATPLQVLRHLALRRGGVGLSSQRNLSCDVSKILFGGPEKHLVTKLALKSLMRSRCPQTLKSLAHLSGGASNVWERGHIGTKLGISCPSGARLGKAPRSCHAY